jgi:cytidylate kinase
MSHFYRLYQQIFLIFEGLFLMDKNVSVVSIAIDGPSGAGKSSLAKNTAKKLGFVYLDTGALYRTIALFMYEKNIAADDVPAVEKCIETGEIKIELAYNDGVQKVYLNGCDVSEKIRENHISKRASDVAKIPEVRAFLRGIQLGAAEKNNVVMDGRDIGTAVLPNAQVKIFLTASPETRAKRRFDELLSKGQKDLDYAKILEELKERDANDMNRKTNPLKAADDAVILDNSDIDEAATLGKTLQIIKEKLPYVSIR